MGKASERSGSRREGEASGAEVEAPGGALGRPDGSLEELAARVRLLERENAALRRSLGDRGWLLDALDATNNTVIVTDPNQEDNPIIYVNRGFEQLTGYTREEALGRNCRFLQGDDTDQEALPALREAVREGRDIRVVLRNYRKDGSLFWNELYVTAVWRDGVLAYFFGVQNDITPLVEAQRQLKLLEAAVEQADESIVITGAELERPGPQIRYVNRAFERLSGYRRDEVLGKTPRVLQGPKTDPQVLAHLRQRLLGGEVFRGETVNYRKDGSAFVNEWHIAPIRSGAGEITHWVATQRDVTERRQLERLVAEAATREQQRVARDLHDTLGQHLAGTAFLARNLATRLRGAGAPYADEAARVAELVQEAVAQTRSLARGLFPVALQEGGLRDALEALGRSAHEVFGAPCTVHVAEDVAVSSEEAEQLYRIVQEALSNALRHGGAQRVDITLQTRRGARVLTVSDDGVGFPPEVLGAQHGAGMGLRIMRYRAQLIGASLGLANEGLPRGDGRGARVTCALLGRPPTEEPARG
ncbi:PAS/PAC sensor signal transduction histidine kinase [Truepera radiovictrix DSM 17093]|uniref:PAS/PAC sensor signal transduction histidine kinase n=1 Tax=Truepera radiovictrix (strain DSM 17093 / CIP 108686 / LMG 22925 / RQ-24) TaxID=649638 RepID=D7CR11_TRURR|nr:PAS/PAC sensor signal transduction histidine kinase [Truepera radiovictrix DSM 17093]